VEGQVGVVAYQTNLVSILAPASPMHVETVEMGSGDVG